MHSIRRILVAIGDCEAKATPALVKAGQLAKGAGARIELFHSITTPLYIGYNVTAMELPQVERTLRSRALSQLEKMAAKLRREDIEVSVAAECDFPAYEAIVRRASQIKADLIVADQHPGRHTAARLLRLTDWELLRLSPVPVLLVKSPGRYRQPVILAALDPGHTFSKPVSLDQRILAATRTIAQALHGTQHVLHAYVSLPLPLNERSLINQESIAKLQAQTKAAAQKGLDREMRASRIPKAQRHLIGRHPADAIAEMAREICSSIVVMGAISRSGLKRLLIGNTAERTLDQLDCDVLIVKPARFTSHVPRSRRGSRWSAPAHLPLTP